MNQHSEDILRELRQKSVQFSEKSSRLSDSLSNAEEFLREIPGKIQISVGDGEDILTFLRTDRAGGWRLWYGGAEFGQWVLQSPIEIKAKAAVLLPQLLRELLAAITTNLQDVEAGLEALNNSPFLKEEGDSF